MFPFTITLSRIALGATAIIGILGLYSSNVLRTTPLADVRIEPMSGIVTIDEVFTTSIVVESDIAVNAFSGQLTFDPAVLAVTAISYNTSIADLWVTEPWYSNGDGTITFAGGTTKPGGFTGIGNLLTVTFRPLRADDTAIRIASATIYQHDGFGTNVPLATPIDALFEVETLAEKAAPIPSRTANPAVLNVMVSTPNFDLNGDSLVNIRDVSLLLLNLFGSNATYDLNQDGTVDTSDVSLLLQHMRSAN